MAAVTDAALLPRLLAWIGEHPGDVAGVPC